MTDSINTEAMTAVVSDSEYPAPDGVYVRRGRCVYCGSKKIQRLWGYDWCDKPCKLGAQVLDIYEREHHLGKYAPVTPEIPDPDESE